MSITNGTGLPQSFANWFNGGMPGATSASTNTGSGSATIGGASIPPPNAGLPNWSNPFMPGGKEGGFGGGQSFATPMGAPLGSNPFAVPPTLGRNPDIPYANPQLNQIPDSGSTFSSPGIGNAPSNPMRGADALPPGSAASMGTGMTQPPQFETQLADLKRQQIEMKYQQDIAKHEADQQMQKWKRMQEEWQRQQEAQAQQQAIASVGQMPDALNSWVGTQNFRQQLLGPSAVTMENPFLNDWQALLSQASSLPKQTGWSW